MSGAGDPGTGDGAVAETPSRDEELPVPVLLCSVSFRAALGAAIAMGLAWWLRRAAPDDARWDAAALAAGGAAGALLLLGLALGVRAGHVRPTRAAEVGWVGNLVLLAVVAGLLAAVGAVLGALLTIGSDRSLGDGVLRGVLGGLRIVVLFAALKLVSKVVWLVLRPRGRGLHLRRLWIAVPAPVETSGAVASLSLPAAIALAAMAVDTGAPGVWIAAGGCAAVAAPATVFLGRALRRHGPLRRFERSAAEAGADSEPARA